MTRTNYATRVAKRGICANATSETIVAGGATESSRNHAQWPEPKNATSNAHTEDLCMNDRASIAQHLLAIAEELEFAPISAGTPAPSWLQYVADQLHSNSIFAGGRTRRRADIDALRRAAELAAKDHANG